MRRIISTVLCAVLLMTMLAACGKTQKLSAAEFLDLGEKYLAELNYEQAIVQFLGVIEVEPKNVRAYLGGADAYLHLDKQADAVNLLTGGVEATDSQNLKNALTGVEKSLIEGYIAIAEAYEAEGWADKALEILQRVYEETGDEVIGRKLGIVEASKIEFRDDYIIQWKDVEFERLIRQYLGKESGDIHYDDVKLIEDIEIWGNVIGGQGDADTDSSWSSVITWYAVDSFGLQNGGESAKNGAIRTLEDIEHFTSLKRLTVCHQTNLDIAALGETESSECLQRLEELTLVSNNINDISVVSNLIALKTLNLSYNSIKDISPISLLIELTSIDIDGSGELSSIDELRGLRKLTNASISNFTSADLRIFLAMPELSSLHLMNLGSADYSILPQLSKLDYLEISCDDSNFQFIKQAKTLTRLRLHGHGHWDSESGDEIGGLTNISGIEALSNLKKLDLLAVNCYDISPLSLLSVEKLEIKLPKDCDLTPLKSMSNLKTVIVGDNSYDPELSEEESMLKKVKALLPDVEVKTDKY